MVNRIATLPPRLLRTFLWRGVTLWLLARITGMAMLAATESSAPVLPVWVVVMTATLTLVDLHRRRELTLLHNLGIATPHVVILATLPAVVAEILLVMLGS